MSVKEIIIAAIFIIFVLPSFIGILRWTIKSVSNPEDTENLEEGVELMAKSAIPWWLNILQKLASLPGLLGSALVIGFIFLLKYVGEVE